MKVSSIVTRQRVLHLCGVCSLIFSLILALCWGTIFDAVIKTQIQLNPLSTLYKIWVKNEVPIYLEIYLFNFTNADEFRRDKTVVPNFEEIGPFLFEETREKVDVSWNDMEQTLTFNQTKKWRLVEELSQDMSVRVTNINPIASTIAYISRLWQSELQRKIANALLNAHEPFLVTASAQEWLFDGIPDKFLDMMESIRKVTEIPIPYNKFGWFYDRNGSSSFDGAFTIKTGASSIADLGMMVAWNHENKTNHYVDSCALVYGSTGEVFPPLKPFQESLSVFASDICSVYLLVDVLEVAGRCQMMDDIRTGLYAPTKKNAEDREGWRHLGDQQSVNRWTNDVDGSILPFICIFPSMSVTCHRKSCTLFYSFHSQTLQDVRLPYVYGVHPSRVSYITLKYSGSVVFEGIHAYEYIGDSSVFDNGTSHSENLCFYLGESCPSGQRNVSSCRFGSPAFISFPHFYLADSSYLEKVTGLHPDERKHKFSLIVEPKLGVPLAVEAAFQINFLLAPYEWCDHFRETPKIYIPMLWFKQTVKMTKEYSDVIKVVLFLQSNGGYLFFYFILCVSFSVFAVLCWRSTKKSGSSSKKSEKDCS